MTEKEAKTGVLGVNYKLEKPLEETILYDKPEYNIARITFNRPEKHNSWYFPDMDLWFCKLMRRALDDDDVKVIILKGNGPSFCTGDDLNRAPAEAFGLRPGERLSQMHRLRGFWELYHGCLREVLFCPKNVISSVHGQTIGIGYMIAESSDLVIASESAKFSHAEQRIGFAGMMCMMMLLHFGPKRARETVLTGESMSAQKAKDWGLVNSIVPDDKLEAETMRWAKMITLHSADGLMNSKMLMQLIYEIMGVGASHQATMMAHTLFTNLQWRPDEMNFLKLRTGVGAREAFKQREARWGELGF